LLLARRTELTLDADHEPDRVCSLERYGEGGLAALLPRWHLDDCSLEIGTNSHHDVAIGHNDPDER
jgi:hypothetical protein